MNPHLTISLARARADDLLRQASRARLRPHAKEARLAGRQQARHGRTPTSASTRLTDPASIPTHPDGRNTMSNSMSRMRISETAPEPYAAMYRLEASIELDKQLRELIKLRASQINGCAFCIDMHYKDARGA